MYPSDDFGPNRIAHYRRRCSPPLTQRELAQLLGTHHNTIGSWEQRGVPKEKELLCLMELFIDRGAIADATAALAFWRGSGQRGLDMPPELYRLLAQFDALSPARIPVTRPVAPAPFPSHSIMPLSRNRRFVGREYDLQMLAAALRSNGATVIISGMAGLGKTQLASEFVHRYGQFFPGGVFWVSFAEVGAVAANIAACGGVSHLDLRPGFETLELDVQVRLVQQAWQEPVPRLLVFDNCEDPALLARWQPSNGGCRVLVTSRRAQWEPTLITHVVPMQTLQRADSVALLCGHSPTLNASDADMLATVLGDLPLALHLAGAYLARYASTLSATEYLAQLSAASIAHPSFEHDDTSPTGYNANVARALTLSYERLDADSPTDQLAGVLLACASCCVPGEPIPRDVLRDALELPSDDPLTQRRTTDAFTRLINDLGLLEPATKDTLRLHRLVAGFTQMQTNDDRAQRAIERAFLRLDSHSADEHDLIPLLVLQHVQYVTDRACARRDEQAVLLCNFLAWSLTKAGRYETAHHYIEQALHIGTQQLGDAHASTAKTKRIFGKWHVHQQRFVDARALLEQACEIHQRLLGPEHPETLEDATYLGLVLLVMAEFTTARDVLTFVIGACERNGGAESTQVARALTWLGYTAQKSGDPIEAEKSFRRARAIYTAQIKGNHAAIAFTLIALGDALCSQRRFDEAEQYVLQSLEMRRHVLGLAHVHTFESMSFLGHIARLRGDLSRARDLLEQSCAIGVQLFSDPPFNLLLEYATLARITRVLGDTDAAIRYTARTETLIAAAKASGDPNIAVALENLARQCAARGDDASAKQLHRWAAWLRTSDDE